MIWAGPVFLTMFQLITLMYAVVYAATYTASVVTTVFFTPAIIFFKKNYNFNIFIVQSYTLYFTLSCAFAGRGANYRKRIVLGPLETNSSMKQPEPNSSKSFVRLPR